MFQLLLSVVQIYAQFRAYLTIFHVVVYQMSLFFELAAMQFHANFLLDPTKYKGHSFRNGAATLAAECGFADAQIWSIGRWKSDAFPK